MKITHLSFIVLLVVIACSKSDSPPALENAEVPNTTIQPPSGLITAAGTNTYAAEALTYIDDANTISDYSALIAVPSGATKSSTLITASNGRVSSTASSTYTWSDGKQCFVAYQITDDGTSYKWEYFIKDSRCGEWLKYLEATAKKDGSTGTLWVFDVYGSDASVIKLKYEWTKNQDQYTFKLTTGGYYFEIDYNISTKAGSIDVYTGTTPTLTVRYTWTGTGSGTWQTFNPAASGTW